MRFPSEKVLLPLFKVGKRITPLEGWFLILHCFLLSGCMWFKLFINEKLSPSSTSQENCILLRICWVPRWKNQIIKYPNCTVSMAHRPAWKSSLWSWGCLRCRYSPGTVELLGCPEEREPDDRQQDVSVRNSRACGKRAVRVLDSGTFKAYLLVDLSQGVSALR